MSRSVRRLIPVLSVMALFIAGAPTVSAQNDAGTGADAGNTFATATSVTPLGEYTGFLGGSSQSDAADYYRFTVGLGDPINIEIRDVLQGGSAVAPDNNRRLSFQLISPHNTLVDTPNSNQGDTRVMVSAAPFAGEWRFAVVQSPGGFTGNYRFCFLVATGPHPCPDLGMRSQDIIFGGALSGTVTRVLLIPPTHGDLGNPFGPTVLDYIDAAVNGIREWEWALNEFANDYPQYNYLKQLSVQIFIFDGTQIFANYHVIIGYVETGGNAFRGVASSCVDPPRCILLSLFSMSPRAGQTLPDYPEYNDIEAVVKHEFAHTWGLGHTLTWTAQYGPDLMNSPATFVYGDNSAVGDGGERTGKQCISSLNLYGMALLYRHLAGQSRVTGGSYNLPSGIPYEWYCPP
jgi:hypothetical protein